MTPKNKLYDKLIKMNINETISDDGFNIKRINRGWTYWIPDLPSLGGFFISENQFPAAKKKKLI